MHISPALLSPLAGGLLLAGHCLAQDPGQDPDLAPRGARPVPVAQVATVAGEQARATTPRLPGGAAIAGPCTPVHTAADDLGQAYGIWAAGDTYKVSFHDGMTFVPYLGRQYPHNQPLSWCTTSAKVGDVELIESHSGCVPVQHDYRFEYDFGGIVEAYDVRAEGLEQSFVVRRLPAAGDLVITGAVTTSLRTRDLPSAHQGIVFDDERGQPIVRYGEAFAIDAVGDRIPLEVGCKNDSITLRVPGSWLANAALPVVVDPLLTRVQVSLGSDLGAVDIGRDDLAITGNVMFTYVRYASANDGDVYSRLVDDDYSNTLTVFTDITSSWNSDDTACAFVGGANRWVVVMRRYFPNLTPTQSRVRAHVHIGGDTTLSTTYVSLITSSTVNEWRPDVGGVESYFSGDKALIVFQSEDNGTGNFANVATSEIWGVVFDPTTGSGSFGAEFPIHHSAALDCERPSVNQVAAGSTGYSWVCALQAYNNSIANDDWDVVVRQVSDSGTVNGATWYSDFNGHNDTHQLGPVVEGSNGRYAVSFATTDTATTAFKTGLITGKQIHIERFDWVDGGSPAGDRAPVLLVQDPDRRWEASGLGFDTVTDSHWAPAYRSVAPLGLGYGYCSRVGFNGEITENFITLYGATNEQVTPVACVFDNDHSDFLFGYGADDTLAPLYGQTLTYDSVTAWSTAGTACSTATISWVGSQQIGSEFGRVRTVHNTPVGHFMIASLAINNVPLVDPVVFPGCRLLVHATGASCLATLPFQYGTDVSWRVSLPEWLDPMTFHFQDWMFDGTIFYATRRLSVPVTK